MFEMKTFSPPSSDRAVVFAQLSKNLENACIKARRYKLAARGIIIFFRQHDFRDHGLEIRFSRATAFPHELLPLIEPAFVYRKGHPTLLPTQNGQSRVAHSIGFSGRQLGLVS
jgi:hypothetical protein